jgi:hypothetical protein
MDFILIAQMLQETNSGFMHHLKDTVVTEVPAVIHITYLNPNLGGENDFFRHFQFDLHHAAAKLDFLLILITKLLR